MSFVHLHVHTTYSLLDGFMTPAQLVKRTAELEMPAVAITDHGCMFGIMPFYNAANAAGIKPIIGLETYLAAGSMTSKTPADKKSSHLLLLAENQTGYQNLLKIASASQLEGFYYYPRIDKSFLAAHSEGLIATTGCFASEIMRLLASNNPDSAEQVFCWYLDLFGRDRFFVELQSHPGVPELDAANVALIQLAQKYNARFVATNDAHYLTADDAEYQDALLAIQTGKRLSDPDRFRMSDTSYYLKSPAEMQSLFGHVPGAIENTLEIAERCALDLERKSYHLPDFPVASGTVESTLRDLCETGLVRRYAEKSSDPVIRERLEKELGIIHQMGFDAYFLIVYDLCMEAKRRGIWYGARGSAAGSIVAYALGITQTDPIAHELIFERFLNPFRISMPDIDLDFQDDRRHVLLSYCTEKYGAEKVAQIITFGGSGAKGAIRDVARILDISLSDADRIAKLIGDHASIQEALDTEPTLADIQNHYPALFRIAQKLEGSVVKNVGTHAAGVVITDLPVIEYCPLHRPTNDAIDTPIKSVTQFEMADIDALGLLKVDFLGLKTLTVMQRACAMIAERHGVDFSIETIPTDDADTFTMLGDGFTTGVFQLEGDGMTKYIQAMRPQCLSDIIAMVALYRPGPLEFIPSYIARMHGEEEVTYRHPMLESIFKGTYGIPIYQEQLMAAVIKLAGYTPAESDNFRKAISKKKTKDIEYHRNKFVSGAEKNGIDPAVAGDIFADWLNFARYGFNRGHAAAYGELAVKTAYLKKYFPVEFMTAMLQSASDDLDKVASLIAESRKMGIAVLPPDVNLGDVDFSIVSYKNAPAICFGLGAIKNVSASAVKSIVDARLQGGAFKSINDFRSRISLKALGKRSLEFLIKGGALSSLGTRKGLLNNLEDILSGAVQHNDAQSVLFDMTAAVDHSLDQRVKAVPDVLLENLALEKELMGIYVSAHPLDSVEDAILRSATHNCVNLSELSPDTSVRLVGMVTRFKVIHTKKGDDMAFLTIEDRSGSCEVVAFPRVWEDAEDDVSDGALLCLNGKIDKAGKVIASRIELADAKNTAAKPARKTTASLQSLLDKLSFGGCDKLRVCFSGVDPSELMLQVYNRLVLPGDHAFEFCFTDGKKLVMRFPNVTTHLTPDLLEDLSGMVGVDALSLPR